MHKSVSEYRDGYKAHIAVEPETGLVTARGAHARERGGRADRRRAARRRKARAAGVGRLRVRLRRGPRRAPRRPAHQAIKAIPLRPTIPAGSTETTSSSTMLPAP